MHATCARIASLRQLQLRVLPRERDIMGRLSPIHVARVRIMAVLDVETTRVADVPIVVGLDQIRLEWTVCRRGIVSVSLSLRDIVCKGRAASPVTARSTSTTTVRTTASVITSTTAALLKTSTIASGVHATLKTDVRWDGWNAEIVVRRGGQEKQWYGSESPVDMTLPPSVVLAGRRVDTVLAD